MARVHYDVTFSPVIIALDVSGSMDSNDSKNRPLDAAARLIPALAELGRQHPTVDEKTRVGMITFSSDANVVLPIGKTGCLSNIDSHKFTLEARGLTYYGKAFDLIRAELEQLPARIFTQEHLEGLRVGFHRPVVFFITDGNPNDDSATREASWKALTGPDFEFSPHFVTCGVGDQVTPSKLAPYRNRRGRVLIAKDTASVAESLTELVELLSATIIAINGAAQDENAPIYDETALSENFDVLDADDFPYDVL